MSAAPALGHGIGGPRHERGHIGGAEICPASVFFIKIYIHVAAKCIITYFFLKNRRQKPNFYY